MRAVVTGGAGFVGSHLVRALLDAGHQTLVVEKPGANLENLARLPVETVLADLREEEAIRPHLREGDLLFHVAGIPHLWTRDRKEFHRTNVLATRHVLSAAKEAAVGRVVFTSTESILGASRNGHPWNEETIATVDDMPGPYCRSKFEAEQEALGWAARGLPIVVVNPTLPVGPGDVNMTPPTKMIADFLEGKIPAYIDATLNLIDVRDVARGHILAAERGGVGERYVLAGENLSVRRIFEVLGEITGIAAPSFSIPHTIALGIAYVSEWWADYVTGSAPRATVTGVRLARRFGGFDGAKAIRDLGLSPRPVRQALEEEVAWLRARASKQIPGPPPRIPAAPSTRSDARRRSAPSPGEGDSAARA